MFLPYDNFIKYLKKNAHIFLSICLFALPSVLYFYHFRSTQTLVPGSANRNGEECMAPDLFHGMSGLLQCISYLTLKKDTNSCMKTNPCLNILQKYSQAGAYFFQEENIFYIPILCSLLEVHTEAMRTSTRLVAGYCI